MRFTNYSFAEDNNKYYLSLYRIIVLSNQILF